MSSSSRSTAFQVTSNPVVEITVYDAARSECGRGTGIVRLSLPPGLYRVHFERAGVVRRELVDHDGTTELACPGPPMYSPAPLTIHDVDGRPLAALSEDNARVDRGDGYAALSCAAAPGTYRIRARGGAATRHEAPRAPALGAREPARPVRGAGVAARASRPPPRRTRDRRAPPRADDPRCTRSPHGHAAAGGGRSRPRAPPARAGDRAGAAGLGAARTPAAPGRARVRADRCDALAVPHRRWRDRLARSPARGCPRPCRELGAERATRRCCTSRSMAIRARRGASFGSPAATRRPRTSSIAFVVDGAGPACEAGP